MKEISFICQGGGARAREEHAAVSEPISYDEMSMFRENAEEFGIPWRGVPGVRREAVTLSDGRRLSALVWGTRPGNVVLLHGGGQNAHTWDTVALALDRPLVAIDLPGHGHSDRGANGSLDVARNAEDVAAAIETLAERPVHVVGMSLGGMTALALTDARPELVASVALVDVTPGVNETKSSSIAAFINGPPEFSSFEDLLARTIEFNPTRSVSSLRRGILHNAVQRADGSWVWRYARFSEETSAGPPDFSGLWSCIDRLQVPLLLARGLLAQSVVDDEDERELLRRKPDARIVHFEQSGHSIQGDEPVALAATLASHFGDP
jgi:pimeloyl-ACP methyl ester carboxylesterase